jgi:hypothetical protein
MPQNCYKQSEEIYICGVINELLHPLSPDVIQRKRKYPISSESVDVP